MLQFIAQYWVVFAFGLIVSGFGWVLKQFKACKLGLQAMLRNSIIDQYNKYIEKAHIPIYAMENVTAMYTQYHALGGNGTITNLYNKLLELPSELHEQKEG
jgi:hypothetical protein